MSLKLFITGTDTEVGKTYVSTSLLKSFNEKNKTTLGTKPVSSGCVETNGQWINPDTELLKAHSSIQLPYDLINPFAFKESIAPHIAAQLMHQKIIVKDIIQKMETALSYPADLCLIEGIGGWYCPMNATETMADFVKIMQFKTVLVVGIRLGCLNHALLTCKAILQDQVPLVGWIANCIDPNMAYCKENIETLKNSLPVPCLGTVDYLGRVNLSIDSNTLASL